MQKVFKKLTFESYDPMDMDSVWMNQSALCNDIPGHKIIS